MPQVCQVNNIDINLIYSDTIEENIISIDAKKELFFDVYECVVNGEKLILEKVGDSELGPKVLLEINIEGKKYSAEAILVDNGSTYVELNKENIYFIRTVPEENLTVEESEIPEVDIDDETSDNIEVNYENIIEHHVNNKLVFLHELEEQFEEKIVSLKDDISNKLDLFFEKLEDKKKIIIEEKLEKITTELDEKFILLQSELHGVEDFSKKNIDSILEKKVNEIDSSVNVFLEGITKEYKNKIISSDKKITHNFLELNSIKDKLKENNSTTNKKFDELNLLKEKLLEQDEVILKNEELKKFINEEFSNIDNKFKNLSEEENKKYNELLAAVSNKDVVEYKTILKEKIQDVELTQIKESLQEEISSALKGDIVSLKRYVEMSSGGGSTAKQFAAGGTMDGNLTVAGDLSARTYLGIDIPPVNGLYLPLSGGNLTGILSSNNTIVADTILATNLLSATTLDIGFELSGFNVTGSLSASGNISSGSLTNPALSTDGIDAKFTDNVIIAGDLDIGFPNENENQCITIHGSNSSGKRTQLIQTGGAFCIHPTVGNQCLILGSLSNHITMLCGNASHELRIPTGKVNIGTTGGTEKLTVAGNISASGGLSANNINVAGDILPSQTTTFNIGSSALRFKDIFLAGSTIDLSGTKISTDSDGDIEFRDAANLPKRLKASEIILESSTDPNNDIVFKVNNDGNPEFQKRCRTNPNIIEPSITTTDILSATQVRVDGNVGIGTGPTTPPNRRLTVVGDISATNNIDATTITANCNLQLGGNIVDTDANELIQIDSNDIKFVGKHVVSGFGLGIRNQRGNAKGIDCSSGSDNTNVGIYNCSIEAITIDNAGNIGIGTTSPANVLTVNGSISGNNNLTVGGNITTNGNISMTAGSDSRINLQGDTIIDFGGDLSIDGGSMNFGGTPRLSLETSELVRPNGSTALKWDNSGVGIGTTSPNEALTVAGNLSATGDITSNGVIKAINNTQNVAQLEVGRDHNQYLEMKVSDPDVCITANQDSDSNGSHQFILNRVFAGTGANNFEIRKGGTPQVTVNTDGNVGIGTQTPDEKLTVMGSISASGGYKVGGGSITSCSTSFSTSLSDNGKTLLLDTSSGAITVSVTPQVSGFSTRFIKEAGAAPVVFSTGSGLSGLYSYQDRNQMSIIYAQADILYKNENIAFLGGNLQ